MRSFPVKSLPPDGEMERFRASLSFAASSASHCSLVCSLVCSSVILMIGICPDGDFTV